MYLDWASRKISPQKVCQSDIVSRGFVGYRPAKEMHLMSCADWEGKVDIILGLNGDVFHLSTPHNSLLINRWRSRHRDPLHHQAHDDNDCFPQRCSIFRTEDQHPPTATHRDVRDTSGINTHTQVFWVIILSLVDLFNQQPAANVLSPLFSPVTVCTSLFCEICLLLFTFLKLSSYYCWFNVYIFEPV